MSDWESRKKEERKIKSYIAANPVVKWNMFEQQPNVQKLKERVWMEVVHVVGS